MTCGGVHETERVKKAQQKEVQWCMGMGMGVWSPSFENMETAGAKAVPLSWSDTTRVIWVDQTKGLDGHTC